MKTALHIALKFIKGKKPFIGKTVIVSRLHKFVITLFITALSTASANGQFFIKVADSDAKPVADAIVFVIPQNVENPYKLAKSFYTDANGIATSTIGGLCVIEISGDGFTTVKDTAKLISGATLNISLNQLVFSASEVVVTGQYEVTTADKSVSKIKIIDAKRMEAQGAVNLKDVLSNELNVRMKQDNILGSSLSLQGISGQNVKILIDGVPMIGRLDGNIDLSQINLNNIERIEIIEGPMSVMYGTDALGGVINLITKKTTKHSVEGNVNSYYETAGNYNLDARVAFKTKKRATVQVSGGRNFFDGFGETGIRGRVQQWKPKEQYFADAIIGFNIKNSTHRIQSIAFDELLLSRGEPVFRPYSVYAFDNYFYTRRFNNSLFSDFKLRNGGHIQITSSYSWFRRHNIQKRRDLLTLEDTQTQGATDHDTSIFTLVMSRGTYTQQVNRKLGYQLGYDVNVENGKGRRIQGNCQSVGDYAAYATFEYRPLSRLVLRPGIRASYNTRYGSPITPSFNTKYTINSKLNLRASYARGFRAPSIKELNLFFVDINHNIQPNSNLKAELSDNVNVSLQYNTTFKNEVSLKIEPSVFYNDIRNMISLAVVDPVKQLYNYVNIGQYSNAGANLSAEVKVKNISLQAGTSLTAVKNYFSANISQYNTTKEYRVNIGYTLPQSGTSFNIFYKYNGRVPGYALNGNNEVIQTFVQSYSMADVSVSQSFLNKRITLVVGARNLLNVGNISYNAPAGAHSGNSNSMAIGMGRTFFTNIRIHLFNPNK